MITVADILGIARSIVGRAMKGGNRHKYIIDSYNLQPNLPRKYKVKMTDHWCATFISYLFLCMPGEKIFQCYECSCGRMIELMKQKGIWHENETTFKPAPGDIIMYDWDGQDGWPEHVGIVESVKGGVLTIIEGNYKDNVTRRVISASSKYIRGYGRPTYDVTIDDVTYNSPKENITQVAKDVIAGHYGNGVVRTQALKKAGHDPIKVQAEVNRLLA